MKMRYVMGVALSSMLVLSACGKSEPSKSEVTSLIVDQVFNKEVQASENPILYGQGHKLSKTQKDKLRSKIEESFKVQNFHCKKVDGMDKTYNCNMILSGQAGDKAMSLRLIRKDDGSLFADDASLF